MSMRSNEQHDDQIAKGLKDKLVRYLKANFSFNEETHTKITRDNIPIFSFAIRSVIFTHLAAISLRSINRFARHNDMCWLKRVMIYPMFAKPEDILNRNCYSWTINGNERRLKRVNERHFWKLLNYLSCDIYLKNYINKHSEEDQELYKRLLTDTALQRDTIKISLKRLEECGTLENCSAKKALRLIESEWRRMWVGHSKGGIILTRWKAIQIGMDLGLIQKSRAGLRPVLVFPNKIDPDEIIKAFEESEELELGTMKSRYRGQGISFRRQLLIYILYNSTILIESDIGSYMGDRLHSAISYSITKTNFLVDENPLIKQLLEYYCIFVDNIRIYKNRKYFFPKSQD